MNTKKVFPESCRLSVYIINEKRSHVDKLKSVIREAFGSFTIVSFEKRQFGLSQMHETLMGVTEENSL